jgi:hypothetical protein
MPHDRTDAKFSFPSADAIAFHRLYRDRVVNEDMLVHNRITWLLSTQTILFLLWATFIKDPTQVSQTSLMRALTAGMCLFGILNCFATLVGVRAALSEIEYLAACYVRHYPQPHPALPLVTGKPDHHLLGKSPPYLLIASCFVAWAVVWWFFGWPF